MILGSDVLCSSISDTRHCDVFHTCRAALSEQWNNMAVTIVYHLCFMVVDLVYCSDSKDVLELMLSSQYADIFRSLIFLLELAAYCC